MSTVASDFQRPTCRQDTHSQHTSVQYSLFTRAERIARASLKKCITSLCALKRICHLVYTCLTLCCSLACRLPRAHHLPHSLFLLPRHQKTHCNRDNTVTSKNTQCIMNISMLSQSTSSAIKNHSGVKTCRVAETRVRQLPHNKEGRSSTMCASLKSRRSAPRGGARSISRRWFCRFAMVSPHSIARCHTSLPPTFSL